METPIKNKENLDIKIELAGPEKWKDFKDLKIESYEGKDAKWFGSTEDNKQALEQTKSSTKEYWSEQLSGSSFGVLASYRDKPIGMCFANKSEGKRWYIYSLFVREEFRGGSGKKIFADCLKEVIGRGGIKVSMRSKKGNERSIPIAESFGFKNVREEPNEVLVLELSNANAPEIVKKINDVLNAK